MEKGCKQSEITRQKISENTKRALSDPSIKQKLSEVSIQKWKNPEYRKMMTENHLGHIPWNKGKSGVYSDETLKKMSEGRKGKHICTEEERKRMSEYNKINNRGFQKGHEGWNKWKVGVLSEETKKKISESHKGMHLKPEVIEILRKTHLGIPRSEETKQKLREAFKGEKHPNWQGGITHLPYCEKWTADLRERCRAFFGYVCMECGTPQNQLERKLFCHHINFDKMSCCNDKTPLFIPLCSSCHGKTNYNRDYWEEHYTKIINQYYGGKCYFTKEEMAQLRSEGL